MRGPAAESTVTTDPTTAGDARAVRVLHVIDGLLGGGAERWVWEIVRLSDPRRAVHRVITIIPDCSAFVYAHPLHALGAYGSGDPGSQAPDSAGSGGERMARFRDRLLLSLRERWPLRTTPRTLLAGGALLPSAWRRLRREAARFAPDVIHGHLFYGLAGALLLQRRLRCPLIYSMPALMSQIVDAGYGWVPPLYRRFHPCIDCFFTAATYREELLRIGVPEARIRFTEGHVDLEPVAAARAAALDHRGRVRQQLAIPLGAPVALSVGRLHPSKGHRHALEALPAILERHPDLYWILLGEGEERDSLLARADALAVRDRVRLPGFAADLLPLYAASDVYLRTSVIEADNQSSFLAMAMGLPVAGFDTGGDDRLPAAGHGLLVPNRDTAALAAAVARIVALPDRGRVLGERGAAYARERLDIRRSIAEFEAAYAAADRPHP